MNNKQVVALIVGLLLVAACAFFPPRRYLPKEFGTTFSLDNGTPSRISVLSPNVYGSGGAYIAIDASRLLAECLVIGALTGVAVLLVRPGRRGASPGQKS